MVKILSRNVIKCSDNQITSSEDTGKNTTALVRYKTYPKERKGGERLRQRVIDRCVCIHPLSVSCRFIISYVCILSHIHI